jgi:hypothetical protein
VAALNERFLPIILIGGDDQVLFNFLLLHEPKPELTFHTLSPLGLLYKRGGQKRKPFIKNM